MFENVSSSPDCRLQGQSKTCVNVGAGYAPPPPTNSESKPWLLAGWAWAGEIWHARPQESSFQSLPSSLEVLEARVKHRAQWRHRAHVHTTGHHGNCKLSSACWNETCSHDLMLNLNKLLENTTAATLLFHYIHYFGLKRVRGFYSAATPVVFYCKPIKADQGPTSGQP